MKIKKKPEDFVVIEDFEINNSGKNFVYTLEKKNLGTVDAVRLIEEKYSCKIKFCGNKDKFAVTKQYLSTNKKIPDLEIKQENYYLKLKFLGMNSEPLSLGSHKGNYFQIKVYETKKSAFQKKHYYFPNYFGEQRFSKNNIKIGELLLNKKYEEALKIIDDKYANEFLIKNPKNYLGALKKIPKKTIRLLLASVQSFEFNKELSKKIKGISLNIAEQKLNFSNEEINNSEVIMMKGWDSGDRRFLFRDYPEISLEGVERSNFVKAENIFFDGEIIKFKLPKGSYATIFLRNIFLEDIDY